MSKFNRWWSSQHNHDADSKEFARRVWQAAIASVAAPIPPDDEWGRVPKEVETAWRKSLAAPMPPTPSQQEALDDLDGIRTDDDDNRKGRIRNFILARPEVTK